MKYIAEFVFAPREHVTIIAYDLNLKGRVLFCCAGQSTNIYEVEYANHGYFQRGHFYADQLAKVENKNA